MLTLLNTNLYIFLLFVPPCLHLLTFPPLVYFVYTFYTQFWCLTLDYIATAFFLWKLRTSTAAPFYHPSVSKFIYPLSSELGLFTEKLLCVASLDLSVEILAVVFWEIILKWTVVQCLEKVCLFLLPQNKQLYVFPWSCPSNQWLWSFLKILDDEKWILDS